MATSFPLVIAATIFTVLALVAMIVAIITTSWYVVQTDDLTTNYGSFQICTEDRTTEGATQECRRVDSQAFVAIGDSNPLVDPCRRSTSELSVRFLSLFFVSVAAVLLSAVSVAFLMFAVVKTARHYLRGRSEAKKRRSGDDGGQQRQPDQAPVESSTSLYYDPGLEYSVMPNPEFVAMLIMPAVMLMTLAVWVIYLGNVKTWLYCDSDPCAFLGQNPDVTVCEASLGYSFAFAVFAWLSATISMVLLILRFVVIKVFGEDPPEVEEEDEEEMAETTRSGGLNATSRAYLSSTHKSLNTTLSRTIPPTARDDNNGDNEGDMHGGEDVLSPPEEDIPEEEMVGRTSSEPQMISDHRPRRNSRIQNPSHKHWRY